MTNTSSTTTTTTTMCMTMASQQHIHLRCRSSRRQGDVLGEEGREGKWDVQGIEEGMLKGKEGGRNKRRFIQVILGVAAQTQ